MEQTFVSKIFWWVAKALQAIAKFFHLTYNEINIIVYYFVIPLTWCIMIDMIIRLFLLTSLWIILWIYIIWSKHKYFSKWCDMAFQLSVEFLLKFQKIGWDYWKASVIICVVIPIIIYTILFILIYA